MESGTGNVFHSSSSKNSGSSKDISANLPEDRDVSIDNSKHPTTMVTPRP